MAGVQNDYNQVEGDPKIRIGNWVEERALLSLTGHSRGSSVLTGGGEGGKRGTIDTATRITGPVGGEGSEFGAAGRDYSTTTRSAHEAVLVAPHGPAFVASIAQPRRADLRAQGRAALAAQIHAERLAADEAARQAEASAASFGAKGPMNRSRVMADSRGRSLEQRAQQHPLAGAAISFHTHHLATPGAIHGATPTSKGVHTFSKDTTFSKPLAETFESGQR
jgi:hypothetical protein